MGGEGAIGHENPTTTSDSVRGTWDPSGLPMGYKKYYRSGLP